MELEKLNFYDINIKLKCKVTNENNITFDYTLNNIKSKKQINYYNIRNKKIYNDLKKEYTNNPSTEIAEFFKKEKDKKRKLLIPYSENYFDSEKFNSMLREYNSISVGDTIDDFIAYLEQIKEINIKDEVNKFINNKTLKYTIKDDYYYADTRNSKNNQKILNNIQKLILTEIINEKYLDSNYEANFNSIDNNIDNFDKLLILVQNIQFLKNNVIGKTFIKMNKFTSKLKEILENINLRFGELIRREISKRKGQIYNYLNNYINLFISDSSFNNQNIIYELFAKLEDNLNKNKDYEQYSEYKEKGKFFEKIPKYNIPNEQNKILLEYSKYFYDKDTLKDLNNNDIIEKIKNDNNTSNIITYYNIFKILKLLLIPDTILFIDNLRETKSGKSVIRYYKVLNFQPANIKNFIIEKNGYYLNTLFNIELEKIDIEPYIIFKTKFIDYFNNNNINNKNYEENYGEKYDNKIVNKEKYKNYGTSIYNIKNSGNHIYIGSNLDYEKILGNFNYIKKTSPLFKKLNVLNSKEIFLNNSLFNYFNSNNKYHLKNKNKDYLNKIIKNYYIDKFLFKKDNILKINENNINYGKIIKTKIIPNKNDNFKILKNNDIRLSIDNNNDNFEVYLNVYILSNETKDYKKNIKKDLYIKTGCIEKANNIDNMFNRLFKFENNYAKNLIIDSLSDSNDKPKYEANFEKKLENKSENKSENKPENKPKNILENEVDTQEEIKNQKAGKTKNKNTKKVKSKSLRNTIKHIKN